MVHLLAIFASCGRAWVRFGKRVIMHPPYRARKCPARVSAAGVSYVRGETPAPRIRSGTGETMAPTSMIESGQRGAAERAKLRRKKAADGRHAVVPSLPSVHPVEENGLDAPVFPTQVEARIVIGREETRTPIRG